MDDEPVIVINSVEDDDWMKALPGYKAEVKISGRKPRVRLKHIPGRHDQRTHGLRGTAAGGVKPKTDAGAAPAGAGSPAPAPMEFDRAKWEGMDAGTRRDEWKSTSQGERDRMADAGNSIKKAQADRLEFAGRRPHTGDVKEDIRQRMDQIGDFVHPESAKMITSTVNELNDALAGSGVPDYLRHRLAMEAVDTLAVQDNEAMGRTLGDHGIHHIKGNIDASMAILDAHPGVDTAEEKSAVYLAQVFHDTGYLTEPSQVFLDEGHPRWSMEHYDKNIRPLVDRALGERAGGDISHLIRTHDSTDVDFEGDPVGTAVRIADNVALFQNEKLPGVFRYVDGNTAVLGQLAEKKITIEQAKQQMTDNIDKANVSPKMKEQFHRAVEELNPSSPKFTIGMLGGVIDGFSWTGGHLQIRLRRDASMDVLQKFLDLGQRQFTKFAEAYGIPKEMLTKGLSFKFRGKTRTGSSKLRGPVVMETVVLEPVVKELGEDADFTAGIVEIGSEKELRPYATVIVLGADATLDADGWHASKKNVEKLLRMREPRGEYVPDIVRWRLDSAIGLGAKVKKLNLPEQVALVEGVVY